MDHGHGVEVDSSHDSNVPDLMRGAPMIKDPGELFLGETICIKDESDQISETRLHQRKHESQGFFEAVKINHVKHGEDPGAGHAHKDHDPEDPERGSIKETIERQKTADQAHEEGGREKQSPLEESSVAIEPVV